MTPPPSLETIDRVIGVVRLFASPLPVKPRSTLAGDLALDLTERQFIACELDEVFGTEIGPDEIYDWVNVEDIARTVDQHVGARP